MVDQVAEVKSKTDIVSVVSSYVPLKKAGRHYTACCPFHSEKTPSFTVSPELQIYKCFGCGESGDVFSFVQKYEGISFFEALKSLATKVGIEIVTKGKGVDGKKMELMDANEIAAKYYHYILTQTKVGEDALKYLLEVRQIDMATIDAFQIGFAPNTYDNLNNFLINKRKIHPNAVIDSGLAYKSDRGGIVDRFRGRVIFPLTNARGGVVALAGRILPAFAKEGVPKYINSPETAIYHKSEALFGFYQAREAIRKEGEVVVVEGELDMISPWQRGVKNIVAIKGSSLTEGHASFLSRFTNSVILALDSDFAGNSAAIKGVVTTENKGLSVKVCELPSKYKDPDEASRADIYEFQKSLKSAKAFWDFLFDVMRARYNPDSTSGATQMARAMVPYLAQIEEPIVSSKYARRLSELVGSSEASVLEAIKKHKSGKTEEVGATTNLNDKKSDASTDRREKLVKQVFFSSLLTKPSELLDKYRSLFTERKQVAVISELEKYLSKNKSFDIKSFVSSLAPEIAGGISDEILMYEGGDEMEKDLNFAYSQILISDLKEDRLRLINKLKSIDSESDNAEFTALQVEIGELTNRIASLDKADYNRNSPL